MNTITQEEFIDDYVKAIDSNNAAIFAGAGLSRASGYVDWKGLLSDIANNIGLDIKKEHDLPAVAQYYKNERRGRNSINQLLVEKFVNGCNDNENLEILSKMPIATYWTTNYDTLIESNIRKAGKIVDVKYTQDSLTITIPKRDAVLYKMHGDISMPQDAVLTKDDYESYSITHKLFITALQGDLITKTFLFLGFSFEDPNLNSILAQIRVLLTDNQRTHYCIMRKVKRNEYKTDEEYFYALTKQDLQISDLLRYSINTLLINEYTDITNILKILYRKYLSKRIFISGSAHTYGDWSNPEVFLTNLSKKLIEHEYHISSGLGDKIGTFIITGALEYLMSNKNMEVERYLTIRPKPSFNQTESGKKMHKEYHFNMIKDCGITLFLFGNKKINGKLENSPGVLEEFKMSLKNNNIIIPIGSTGFSSKIILDYIKDNISDFSYLEPYIDILENEKKENKLINTILKIIDSINISDFHLE